MSKIQPQEKVTEFSPRDFQKEYEKLCQKMGMLIVPSPAYIKRDDGTFSTVINLTIGELPKPKETA